MRDMRRYLLVYIVVVLACHYYSRAETVKLNAGRLKQVLPIGAKSAALLTAIFSSGTFDSHGSSSCPCADCAGFSPVPVARAANLPTSNGASGKLQGSEASLQAIRRMGKAAQRAKELESDMPAVRELLRSDFPSNEKAFKKAFDEYSQGVSYKQQFLDKNAFLVYYTQGYDGPGRQNIETETSAEQLQKNQYGFRNDAWVAFDDASAEADYLILFRWMANYGRSAEFKGPSQGL